MHHPFNFPLTLCLVAGSLLCLFGGMAAEGAAQGQLLITDPALRGVARLAANVLASASGLLCLAFTGVCVWHRTQENRARERARARMASAMWANRPGAR